VRVAAAVVLSPEERNQLERWSRGKGASGERALRARIVLEAANGRQDLEIARALGIGRLTSARWRHRFLALRLRGISLGATPRVAVGRVSEDRVRSIVQAARRRNASSGRRWSTRSLARAVGVSHSTVRRVWAAYGVRPVGYEAWPPRPDPGPPLVPTDVIGLYLRPPDYAVAFTAAPGPLVHRSIAEAEGSSVGISTAFGPLIQEWPARVDHRAGHRAREFLGFAAALGPLDGVAPNVLVHATAPTVVPTPEFRRWRARHPGIRFQFQASPEAWRERLVLALTAIARSPVPDERFGSRGELSRALRLFLDAYPSASGPFQWVASPAEVAAQTAGGRLRYDLSVTGHPGFKRPARVVHTMRGPGPADPRIREMARVVLLKSLGLRKGERVTIESWTETLDAANAFVLETLRLGAQPLLLYQDEPTYWAAASEVRPASLARVGEHERAALERSDVFVSFFGPSDRERYHALPRPTMFKLGEHRDSLYRAAAKGGTRAVQIALGRASEPSARMYGVDLERWRNELIDATLVDPQELHRRAVRVARRLQEGRVLEIRHPNGTHLKLGLLHRPPDVSDGLVARARPGGSWNLVQLPAGVVAAALDESVGEGTFRSNVSNSVGVMDSIGEVVGGRWTFEGGRLSRFAYDTGQELFAQSYDRAGPGKERPGAISIGLNERIDISPLLQDQAVGAITLQIGRNDQVGGRTKTDWWAWLILRGADLSVDGRRVVRGGKLVP
jgi:leucyl aminopeptidase (aminopeptidase T)